jgi:hypothetical protein
LSYSIFQKQDAVEFLSDFLNIFRIDNPDFISYFDGSIFTTRDGITTPVHHEITESFVEFPIQIRNITNLYDSLKDFIQEKEMTGDNKWQIENGDYIEAKVSQIIEKIPMVIFFHLQRFEYDNERGIKKKINDFFEFPFTIDMSPYVRSTNQQLPYQLIGIINHRGTAEAGHYVSYRQLSEAKWKKYNDISVDDISIKDLKTENFGGKNQTRSAYCLVYHRISHIKSPILYSSLFLHLCLYNLLSAKKEKYFQYIKRYLEKHPHECSSEILQHQNFFIILSLIFMIQNYHK